MTIARELDRLRSRSQTYSFLLGVVCTMLIVALLAPFTLGDRPDDDASLSADGGPIGTSPSGSSGFGADRFGSVGQTSSDASPVAGPETFGEATPTVPGEPSGRTPTGQGSRPPADNGSADRTATPAGGSGGGGGSPAPGAEPRRASDQGITPDTIRIGALVTDLGGTSALGFEPSGYSPAEQRGYFDAHVTDINKRGGIGGRKLEVVYETVDILDPESMRAACRALADDRKVFAVVHVLGVYGDPILCFTQQKKLPYVAWDGAVFDYYARSEGYLVTTQPSTRRTSLDMARRLHQLGELKGKKVGILRYAEYLDADMNALIEYTRTLGVEVVDAVISVSNVGAVPSQLSVAVNRFQSEGVNQVFLMTNTLYAQQFVSQAERQQYLPAYAVSDFDYASAGNGFLSDMPDSFFRRGLLVTATRLGDASLEEPGARACIAAASAHAGRPITPDDERYFDYLPTCGLLRVVEQGLNLAGTNPTRASLVAAIPRIGRFENVGFGASSFGPSKLGAPDTVRVVRASLDCRCWRLADDFQPTGFKGT